MKRMIFIAIAIFVGLNLYAQQRLDAITLIGKTGTTYQFTISGQDLDEELIKFKTEFGKPVSESPGEIIWNNIEIPTIGQDLQLIILDGLLTTQNGKAKFKAFKDTRNKNKSKNCQLKCLDENKTRQLYLTVLKNDENIINNETMKKDVIEYLGNSIE